MPRREHERELPSSEIHIFGEHDSFVSRRGGTAVAGEGQREASHRQNHRPDVGTKLLNQPLRAASADVFGSFVEERDGCRDLTSIERDEGEQTARVAQRGVVVGRRADCFDLLGDRDGATPVAELHRLYPEFVEDCGKLRLVLGTAEKLPRPTE